MQRPEPLPTKEQLAQIDDVEALENIRESISQRTIKIETDLEFSDRDDDWAARARNALALHRYTERLVGLRLKALNRSRAPVGTERAREDCDPLSLELLDGWTVDLASLVSADEAEAALRQAIERSEALISDRDDEVNRYPPGERDADWLSAANAAIRRVALLRNDLLKRASELRKAQKQEVQASRERAFIDAARLTLDRHTYMALWDEADRILSRANASQASPEWRDMGSPPPAPDAGANPGMKA